MLSKVGLKASSGSVLRAASRRGFFTRSDHEDTLITRFEHLPIGSKCFAEYVWIDGTTEHTRSKGKVLDKPVTSVEELDIWGFDGSSTGQAVGHDSDVLLKPVRIYRDPFRSGENNILVLCETLNKDHSAHATNARRKCSELMEEFANLAPQFGIEQEYIINGKTGWPLGWHQGHFPAQQGQFYCAAGGNNVAGRSIVEAHMRACLYAGIGLAGINAEVMPSQWEYQIFEEGVKASDDLWMARYIHDRIAEEAEAEIDLHPKPIMSYNGSGAHCNFSTKPMRDEGGMKHIEAAIEKLAKRHKEHMDVYGAHNELRMTGLHETAHYDRFSWGISDRGASVRITRNVANKGCGYLEDRRPSSNMDPYLVTGILVETTCKL